MQRLLHLNWLTSPNEFIEIQNFYDMTDLNQKLVKIINRTKELEDCING